ncbi:MAG: mannitol dehydrogenase family protein [Oscillospiraceae bacterium]|nr:mannitol dehydrogenase family protein [Oscillospiraceae bacterium]
MKLRNQNLSDPFFAEKGYLLPQYDRNQMIQKTKESPTWVHMGAGNIFRSFIAQAAQDMLDCGRMKTGIIVSEGFDYEILDKAYRPFDNLCVNVILKPDGGITKSVVGSIAESQVMDPQGADWARLQQIFSAPSLQLVSFTITEKGYNLKDAHGAYLPAVLADFQAGPDAPQTYLGKVAALCYTRYLAGQLPLALVSMDNCSHNGKRLMDAVCDFAKRWSGNRTAEAEFFTYISGSGKVTFPWTAIDKITPRPDVSVQDTLIADGLEDVRPVETARHTFVAPFVNAEQTQYLIVEDSFPNGHPDLRAEGVFFGSRETVEKFEQMKVCTCLNPLHTCLAVLGCMMKYDRISEEMKNSDLRTLIERIAFEESMPVVVDPGIVEPMKFAKQVIEERLPNPFIPDTPQRIACDTSQKLSIRFGNTIKAYAADEKLDVLSLKYIPFTLAAWCRYLLAVDDAGDAFTPSQDPMLETVQAYVKDVRLGRDVDCHEILQPILSNDTIFGVDLYAVGLAPLVERYFARLIAGPGAIADTLRAVIAER